MAPSGETVCVGALVATGDDEPRLLLGRRAAARRWFPGVWDMPGGHVEAGETLADALVRELREEIGVHPIEYRHAATEVETLAGGGRLTVHVFVVTAWNGTPTNQLPEEHDEIGWFTVDEACRLNLASSRYPGLFRATREQIRPST